MTYLYIPCSKVVIYMYFLMLLHTNKLNLAIIYITTNKKQYNIIF